VLVASRQKQKCVHELAGKSGKGGNAAAAALIGKRVAEKALKAGLPKLRSTAPVSVTTAVSRRWQKLRVKPV
jgi:ribosomal protein L18